MPTEAFAPDYPAERVTLVACLNMKLWLCCLASVAAAALWAQDAPPLNAAEKQFQEAMTNVTLTGYSTSGDSGETKQDRYVIERVTKVKDDVWKFDARIQYNNKDIKVAIPVPVKWAGDTPVLSLTDFSVPGAGSYTARVVIYGGAYAGTWGNPSHGGRIFGKIVKNEAAPKP
jgi:hypothetical protein